MIFAQSFETGQGHYFELKRRPGGFLRNDSYFQFDGASRGGALTSTERAALGTEYPDQEVLP